MRKEEERKTKQKRRVVNAAPEQENEITQKKSAWRSCAGQGRNPAPAAGLARPGLPVGRDSAREQGGRSGERSPGPALQQQAGVGRGAGVCVRVARACAVQEPSQARSRGALPPRLDLLIMPTARVTLSASSWLYPCHCRAPGSVPGQ